MREKTKRGVTSTYIVLFTTTHSVHTLAAHYGFDGGTRTQTNRNIK